MKSRTPVWSRGRSAQFLFVYVAGLGIWCSGVAWLYVHYFLQQQSAFGLSANPAEHWWLAIHGAFAFASLMAVGMMWPTHIVPHWRTGRRRVSGPLMLGTLFVLIVTGYLLYYAASDDLRNIVSKAHWIIGLTVLVTFTVHRSKRRSSKSTPVSLTGTTS